MTQWLVEEAAFAALDRAEALAEKHALDQAQSQAALREMALRQVGR